MNVLMKTVFGSHLYGLDTPNSDKDYKGIYLPTKEELLLGTAAKSINRTTGSNDSKNGADDVDDEMYSLAYFVELALKGETVALDMLHATNPLETSPEWEFLVANRDMFYTRNLKAFMGYLKRQVAKYSVKGSRLADITKAINAIKQNWDGSPDSRLWAIFEALPEGEYLKKVDLGVDDRNNSIRYYEVNAKRYQSTVRISEVLGLLQKMYDGYGARAKLAEKNDSIDWKAVSHAFRAGYQLYDIYMYGDFEYPLSHTSFIKQVKAGELDFKTVVQPALESLMEKVDQLALESDLPEKPDRGFWERWLISVYEDRLL